MLKRVSIKETRKKKAMKQHFSQFYRDNNALKNGNWKAIVVNDPNIQLSKLFSEINAKYRLENDVLKDMVVVYHTYKYVKEKGTGRIKTKRQVVSLKNTDGFVLKGRRVITKFIDYLQIIDFIT